MRTILLVIAIGLFVVGAAVAFDWFSDTPADPLDVLGLYGLGLAAFAGSFLASD